MSLHDLACARASLAWRMAIGLLTFALCSLPFSSHSFQGMCEDAKSESPIAELQKADESFEAIEALLLKEGRRKADRPGEEPIHLAYVFSLIAKYRLVRGAPLLLDRLESQPLNPDTEWDRFMSFPAAAALAQIGSPCLRSIYDRCRKPVSERQADIIACVLATIYGDNEIATMVVTKELTRVKALPPNKVNGEIRTLKDSLQLVLRYLRDKDYANFRHRPK